MSTDSPSAGEALTKIAQSRPQPIPVYAEMSSINPAFLLPQALAPRHHAIAEGFAGSLTMRAGQFCTKPVVAVWDPDARGAPTARGRPSLEAVAGVLREEVAERARYGARYIQLDAPHYPLLLDPGTHAF